MNINPMNSFPRVENIPKETNLKPKEKVETSANVVSISSTGAPVREKIQALKQSMSSQTPERAAKIKDAKELLKSGAVHSKEVIKSTAHQMLNSDLGENEE